MLHLYRDAALDQGPHHVRPQVGVVVRRRDREVAALVARLVAEVAARLVAAGVPGALDRVDVVVAGVRRGLEPRGVKDVELRLGAEEGGVADAAAAQVVLGLAGDVARVAGVRLAGQRVVHEEREVQRLAGPERVDHGGGRVGQQQHVRFVDLLEAADRGAVEHQSVAEDLRVKGLRRDREMLHRPRQVAEPDVDELHRLRLDEPQHLIAACEHPPSLAPLACWRPRLGAAGTLGDRDFRAVSPMFRRCYERGSAGPSQPGGKHNQARSARVSEVAPGPWSLTPGCADTVCMWRNDAGPGRGCPA